MELPDYNFYEFKESVPNPYQGWEGWASGPIPACCKVIEILGSEYGRLIWNHHIPTMYHIPAQGPYFKPHPSKEEKGKGAYFKP